MLKRIKNFFAKIGYLVMTLFVLCIVFAAAAIILFVQLIAHM